jgi:hypothetical protein
VYVVAAPLAANETAIVPLPALTAVGALITFAAAMDDAAEVAAVSLPPLGETVK